MTDSEAIRCCLEEAKKASPDRTIVFDGKDYYIDEAICLPSNTHVIVDGCTIKQNDRVYDNIFRGDNLTVDPENPNGYVLDIQPQRNIRIEGRNGAKLIGTDVPRRGYHPVLKEEQDMIGDFWGWRTLMISLNYCDGFEISGLELSQTMNWAVCFGWCCNGYVHDMTIYSHVKNGDGIDFRSGCHHCKVENIYGYTSDDTVACTALYNGVITYPDRNYLYPIHPAAACMDALNRDIHHIEIRNIFTGGSCHGVICLAAFGNQVHDILIDTFEETDEGGRESIVKIYTAYGDGYNSGDLHDITVKNICSQKAQYAVQILADVKNVTTENIIQENPDGLMFN